MRKADDLMAKSDAGSDFKAIIDGVDKLSTPTKINDRHGTPKNIQQDTQTNSQSH